ncbi:hypothetical protein MOQ72_34245 [Saccharopolyspora sp. K220]|uniref:hypothetical protein n=1 Tax=Saccharopolyspora soli TaxID=2926618 RepID=UPI001F58880B|nr:hypothetical protein [Saccharopolyspora soli]MCI2422501.1 hypothetical protein [Saccharopolyspora soli]
MTPRQGMWRPGFRDEYRDMEGGLRYAAGRLRNAVTTVTSKEKLQELVARELVLLGEAIDDIEQDNRRKRTGRTTPPDPEHSVAEAMRTDSKLRLLIGNDTAADFGQ